MFVRVMCEVCLHMNVCTHINEDGNPLTNKGQDAVESSLDTGCLHKWPSGMANSRGRFHGFLPTLVPPTLIMMCLGISEFVLRGLTYISRRMGSELQ